MTSLETKLLLKGYQSSVSRLSKEGWTIKRRQNSKISSVFKKEWGFSRWDFFSCKTKDFKLCKVKPHHSHWLNEMVISRCSPTGFHSSLRRLLLSSAFLFRTRSLGPDFKAKNRDPKRQSRKMAKTGQFNQLKYVGRALHIQMKILT